MKKAPNWQNQLQDLAKLLPASYPFVAVLKHDLSRNEASRILAQLLRDDTLETRVGETALALVPRVDGKGLLVEVLQVLEQRGDLAVSAGVVLGEILSAVLSQLREVLVSSVSKPQSKAGAARALGTVGACQSIESLLQALRSSPTEPVLLDYAAEALGNLRALDAVPDLVKLLVCESADIRFSALCALGNIGSVEALPAVEGLIGDRRESIYGVVGDEAARVAGWLRTRDKDTDGHR